MKSIRIFALTIVFIFTGFIPMLAQPIDSILTDREGNNYSIRVLANKTTWMSTNLKLNIPDSYCYEYSSRYGDQYGRLYTWDAAQKGCSLLEAGWRLPSDEDWMQLSRYYGYPADSTDFRKGAYQTLLSGGSAGFNALLGGGRETEGKFARLEAHGFYWTATEIDSNTAWNYNFAKGSQRLYRQDGGEKSDAYSVRCVKKTN